MDKWVGEWVGVGGKVGGWESKCPRGVSGKVGCAGGGMGGWVSE